MPIYAYRCSACGHAQDVLQKMSDPLLTVCPSCGGSTYQKQLTAAGFQLKGSGWYVTDFREGQGKKPDAKPADGAETAKPAEGAPAAAAAPASADKPATAPAPAPAAAKAAPAAGPSAPPPSAA